jgi:hypothetical protein
MVALNAGACYPYLITAVTNTMVCMAQIRKPMFDHLAAEAHAHGDAQCRSCPRECGRIVTIDGHAKVHTHNNSSPPPFFLPRAHKLTGQRCERAKQTPLPRAD